MRPFHRWAFFKRHLSRSHCHQQLYNVEFLCCRLSYQEHHVSKPATDLHQSGAIDTHPPSKLSWKLTSRLLACFFTNDAALGLFFTRVLRRRTSYAARGYWHLYSLVLVLGTQDSTIDKHHHHRYVPLLQAFAEPY